MRKIIVGTSWKMHIHSMKEGEKLVEGIYRSVGYVKEVEMFILPTYPMIPMIAKKLETGNIKWGAQNICMMDKGAYTGEVPPLILKELGCSYIEIGHAERRATFGETDKDVHKKVRLSLEYDMIPVVCIGETEEDKREHVGNVRLHTQVLWALNGLPIEEMKKVILAYEPVWAIGKAEAAGAEYVENIHGYVRSIIEKEYGRDVAQAIRIIYGGSVNRDNTNLLTKQENVDGLFVGRFGLNPEDFSQIVKTTIENKSI
ncbi:triose-phosphate isomerase [Geosporobacter ferrireducens]|uniref:Triosephosphate isomerase n=1 Tax=Geosporobacter ferrireducens TaxID=1424294 RepID=A0A1D8GK61_9FIRM|nr:triose-phosphate isomerase [Geosporobacter ferrireducens]AOT71293.1 triose-phosphate isomerase [Geosporobacter ferrireducens]MTI58107.1 triose-phosphate isomerase [Geosporobacter ferrireducens]